MTRNDKLRAELADTQALLVKVGEALDSAVKRYGYRNEVYHDAVRSYRQWRRETWGQRANNADERTEGDPIQGDRR